MLAYKSSLLPTVDITFNFLRIVHRLRHILGINSRTGNARSVYILVAERIGPDKRDYRQLGIGQKPNDDKRTYQDLRVRQVVFSAN
jgi:hypothetical protein